jgi:hypothetical protein
MPIAAEEAGQAPTAPCGSPISDRSGTSLIRSRPVISPQSDRSPSESAVAFFFARVAFQTVNVYLPTVPERVVSYPEPPFAPGLALLARALGQSCVPA